VKRRPSENDLRKEEDDSETPDARVLVVRVMGSRRRLDASRVARREEPQGKPRGARWPKGNRYAAGTGDGETKVRRCAEVAQIRSDEARRTLRGRCGGEIRDMAPRGPDTTEGTLVRRRPPHGGTLHWENGAGLGEPGEANETGLRASGAKPRAQAAVRLEPAMRCLASDTGCQRTA